MRMHFNAPAIRRNRLTKAANFVQARDIEEASHAINDINARTRRDKRLMTLQDKEAESRANVTLSSLEWIRDWSKR